MKVYFSLMTHFWSGNHREPRRNRKQALVDIYSLHNRGIPLLPTEGDGHKAILFSQTMCVHHTGHNMSVPNTIAKNNYLWKTYKQGKKIQIDNKIEYEIMKKTQEKQEKWSFNKMFHAFRWTVLRNVLVCRSYRITK